MDFNLCKRILKFRVSELKEFLYPRKLQFQWLLKFNSKNPQIIFFQQKLEELRTFRCKTETHNCYNRRQTRTHGLSFQNTPCSSLSQLQLSILGAFKILKLLQSQNISTADSHDLWALCFIKMLQSLN